MRQPYGVEGSERRYELEMSGLAELPLALCGRISEADKLEAHAVPELFESVVLVQDAADSGELANDSARDIAAAVVVESAVGELQHAGILVEILAYNIRIPHDRAWRGHEWKPGAENHRRAGGQLKVGPE